MNKMMQRDDRLQAVAPGRGKHSHVIVQCGVIEGRAFALNPFSERASHDARLHPAPLNPHAKRIESSA